MLKWCLWFFLFNKCKNEIVLSGDVVHKFKGDCFTLGSHFYETYNITPFYVMLCLAHMYYVMHKQENLTRMAIHLGLHDHPMVKGRSRKVFEQVKSLIEEEAFHTLKAIAFAVNKFFLSKHLLNGDGQGPVEVLKGDKLCQVMDKFLALFSPNVHNLVTSFKRRLRNRRYVSNIFILKVNSGYC